MATLSIHEWITFKFLNSGNNHGVVEEAWFLLLERVAEWLLERHFLKHFLIQPFRPVPTVEIPR